ncbi:MAG: SGNH/GDSL hydrolase family protein [Cyclobacteriaceae bacterium]
MIRNAIFLLLTILSTTMSAQNSQPLKYLALGDSYTIGESVAENERWPVQLAEQLRAKGFEIDKPRIIATTGWRTDNLKNGINIAQIKETYDLVSLLIGVNNQYQGKPVDQYAIEYEDLLKTAVGLAGGDKEKVFVVSIPDYGFTPFGKPKQEKISKELDEFNEVNKRITESYGIQYFNITDISRHGFDDPELVASDGLHPSGRQYKLWVDRIVESLKVVK